MTQKIEYSLAVTEAPQEEPVSLDEALAHLRVDDEGEEEYIESLITTAREWLEEIANVALVTQEIEMRMDAFPTERSLRIPRVPLQSVDAIEYIDEDGTTHTMSASDYLVDARAKPGRIVLKNSSNWPTDTLQEVGAVTIRFDAGFGEAADVPKIFKQILLLQIAHWYENRETVIVGAGLTTNDVPFGVKSLLANVRY